MDQGSPHTTRYTETNRRESREELQTNGHREIFSEQNTDNLFSKINNRQTESHKIAKAKDTVNRTIWQSTDWEKIFTNPTSDRELISKIYKELKNVDSRESNNPIKNGV